MSSNTETICDDNGFELLVNYDFEKSESQVEEGHGRHEVGCMVYTELRSIELVVAGRGIQLLKHLTTTEKEFIISKLQYD